MVETNTGSAREQRRRDRLRSAGLQPVQIWVPDTRAPGFAEECARQAALVRDAEAGSDGGDADAWHAVSDTTGWTG